MFGKFKKLLKGLATEAPEAIHQPEAREHHYIFVHDAFRSLMFDNDGLAERLGTPGGVQMILSLWEKVGQRVVERGTGEALSPEGLEVVSSGLRVADNHVGIMAVIQLPEPVGIKEAYFIGVTVKPLAKPWETPLRYFTLEVGKNGTTVLGEWDEDTHTSHGAGPLPDRDAFIEAVWKIYTAG